MNDKGKPKAQVIYYTRSGKTRLIAKSIAKQLECDLLEVADLKDRSGIKGFIGGIIDVRRQPITEIEPSTFDFESYDLLIVCRGATHHEVHKPLALSKITLIL